MKRISIIIALLLLCTHFIWAQQVVEAEYFWDTDPGQGSATTILALDGNLDEAIEELFSNAVNIPSAGMHKFNIRIKGLDGNWGSVFSCAINVTNAFATTRLLNVVEAEYFWDTDPGVGAATTILALDGNLDEAIEELFTNAVTIPTPGMHLFNIRIKGVDNTWGNTFSYAINVVNPTAITRLVNVVEAEYFWDTDPGVGAATTILALDGNLDEAIEELFTNAVTIPTPGMHLFNIRVKGVDNTWGNTFSYAINVVNPTAITRLVNVVEAEYFWDTDPGVGAATTILALDGNLEESIEELFTNAVTIPTPGMHLFNIRIKGVDNSWGNTFSYAINVVNPTAITRLVTVVQAEYFWDTDPGEGSATPILALDGNLNEAIEELFTNTLVYPAPGMHLFNIRVKGQDGTWSSPFRYAINVNQGITYSSVDTSLCTGGYTVPSGDETYFSPGVYTDTVPNAASLDSIITINLSAGSVSTSTLYPLACGSYVSPAMNTYTVSGTYNEAIPNANGCDSLITIHLIVGQHSASTITPVVCDTYLSPEGNTYTSSGTYMDTIPNISGCDSVITINLTVNSGFSSYETVTACDSYFWGPNSTNYTTSGTYSVIFTGVSGCDSTYYLDLTIITTEYETEFVTACNSFDWIDGNTYTASTNSPTHLIVGGGVNGCDKLITLDLTIITTEYETEFVTACNSFDWIDGNTYTASTNSPTHLIVGGGANGCDKLITLDLTIITTEYETEFVTACNSFDWIDGNTYTASTNSPTHLIVGGGANGCDKLVTLDLTIITTEYETEFVTACNSFDWIDGNTYTASTNSPTHLIVGGGANGCDKLVTLDLTIITTEYETEFVTACNSFDWIDGNTYTASTNLPTHLIVGGGANGCDKLVTLDLTIITTEYETEFVTACNSFDWIDGNTYTASTNSPTHLIVGGGVNGCDKLITLDLTISTTEYETEFVTACNSFDWIDGNTYTASTNSPTYLIVGGGANGCDKLVTLDLSIITTEHETEFVTACNSFDWIDGNTYTASTNSPTNLIVGGGANGCDKLVTLDLTISTTEYETEFVTACNSFDWIDGNTYTASTNSPTHLIVGGGVNGCDKLITLDLTIITTEYETEFVTACNSFDWIDGNTYTASTNSPTHLIVGGGANGCDKLVTLDLTIITTEYETEFVTACNSFDWIDGNTYTASTNSPTHLIVGGGANGCDKLVTLDLTIITTEYETEFVTACNSFDWIDGNTYTASTNSPTHLIVGGGANGCDKLVTLDLTIITTEYETEFVTACNSFDWIDGNTYTASTNSPTHLIVGGGANGCDKLVTLDLTIMTTEYETESVTACNSFDWIDGNTYTASTNSPTHLIVGGGANGCDKLITLDLTITTTEYETEFVTACNSFDWIDGNTYTASTNSPTHLFVGGGANGCDKLVTLDLTIITTEFETEFVTACNSFDWIDGNTYTASTNSPTHLIVGGGANGCDKLVTLDLSIITTEYETEFVTACNSFDWIDGNTYTASTNSPTHLIVGGGANGCDKLVTLDLTIITTEYETEFVTACNSFDWIDGNTYTASTNSPTHLIVGGGANGCDKLVTLDLTIITTEYETEFVTACNSFDWIDGNTYTASTNSPTHLIVGGGANGCDKLVTLDLTIITTEYETEFVTACNSFDWIDGNTYTASTNSPTHLIVGGGANGCDKLVTLDLSIITTEYETEFVTACNSFDWIDGNTYTASTNSPTHLIVGGGVNGCDKLITLDLTIITTEYETESVTTCNSFDWIDGNTYTASTNSPTHLIVGGGANGCDKLVTLDLTITTPDASISQSGETLLADASNVEYQWVACPGMEEIPGAINQEFTPVESGEYAVIVSENGCSATSACVSMSISALQPSEFESQISVYPNPTQGEFTIDLGITYETVNVSLFDARGKLVLEETYSGQIKLFDLEQAASGMYTLQIQTAANQAVFKLIKQ